MLGHGVLPIVAAIRMVGRALRARMHLWGSFVLVVELPRSSQRR